MDKLFKVILNKIDRVGGEDKALFWVYKNLDILVKAGVASMIDSVNKDQ
ncbi:hypothetical protein [Psychromonas ingrahamii]|nr:hypothetical protein [Psychromonas ingrahamii]